MHCLDRIIIIILIKIIIIVIINTIIIIIILLLLIMIITITITLSHLEVCVQRVADDDRGGCDQLGQPRLGIL